MKKLFFSFAVLLTISVSAQTIKKYSGQMSKPEWISELIGDGTGINGFYSYYEDERENRIIHGEFRISHHYREIKGHYDHGIREGAWIIKYNNPDIKHVNYLYQFSYKDGLLNGPFHFYFHGHHGNDIEITGQFRKGVLYGKIVIKDKVYNGYTQVEGMVNGKGNPHGVWTEKEVSAWAIPKDITRLYYDGNLVYRREYDLSSGKIVYTYSVSDEIRVPADTAKISDTIIKGKEYIKVGAMVCVKDTEFDIKDRFEDDRKNEDGCVLYGVVIENRSIVWKIYPSISNWRTRLDSHSYAALVEREQEEERQRKYEQLKEEKAREERIQREKAAEEERTRREQQAAEQRAKGIREWNENKDFYLSVFGDSVNFMYHLENNDWESYANDVIDNEYNGWVFRLSNDIVDRSAKGYKKEMDTIQVNRVFSSQYTYILARKQGRERVTNEIISYDKAQKATRKEKDEGIWGIIGSLAIGVALLVGGIISKWSASSN